MMMEQKQKNEERAPVFQPVMTHEHGQTHTHTYTHTLSPHTLSYTHIYWLRHAPRAIAELYRADRQAVGWVGRQHPASTALHWVLVPCCLWVSSWRGGSAFHPPTNFTPGHPLTGAKVANN